MDFRTKLLLVIFLSASGFSNIASGDDSNDAFIFEVNRLPLQNVMPALSNGHLGFEVYGNTIFLNGLYNGPHGNSHRARIPNFSNLQFPECGPQAKVAQNCTFRMNIKTGVFETIFQNSEYRITQEIYPHRYFNRAIVNKITLVRLNSRLQIDIPLDVYDGGVTTDLFSENSDFLTHKNRMIFTRFFTTRVVEDIRYQYEPRKLYLCMTTPTPGSLSLPSNLNSIELMHVVTISHDPEESFREIQAVLDSTDLTEIHAAEWTEFWNTFDISVDDDDKLNKIIRSSIFYLVSNLPSPKSFQPNGQFYGLSPSGIAKPHYQGHSFWDTEIWMHPPILLMNPKWSEDLLNYRSMMRKAVLTNAEEIGYKGYKYPWEAGFTGTEVTDFCCPEVVKYQHHINADIAFAVRSHMAATQNLDWFKREGCHIAYNTAKFWESRVTFNVTTMSYDIRNVMGPDEDHHDINNNAYTNVIAAMNLNFGSFSACICKDVLNLDEKQYAKLHRIARDITLIHDRKKDFHPQFEGYKIGTPIKQADTVLLGYPLQLQMKNSTKKNNLEIYENVTRVNGPAMTWAMHTIGYLDIKDYEKAKKMFEKSYEPYLREPFMNWYEVAPGTIGAENFITGAGGFLQAIINGYGGIRLHFNSLNISNFYLPPDTDALRLKGIQYLGNRFTFHIMKEQASISFQSLNTVTPIELLIDGLAQDIKINTNYTMKFNSTASMRSKSNPYGSCKLREFVPGAATTIAIQMVLILTSTLFLFTFN